MIKKFLGSEIVTVFEGTSIQQVAQLMDEKSVGTVVITERYSGGKPIGLVTDRDIVVKAVKKNLNANLEYIDQIMTRHPIMATENATIEEAIKIMETSQIRRLLVVDEYGKLKGLVSIDDILALLGNEINRLGSLCHAKVGTAQRHRNHDYTKMA